MRVVWTSRALADLDAVIDFYEQFSPLVAVKRGQAIMAMADGLLDHPELGALAFDVNPPGVYRHLVRSPIRLFYRFEPERGRILIIRVWDGRRDPQLLDLDVEED